MINIMDYKDLRSCAGDTVNLIQDDDKFCEAEYELFRDWCEQRGFSNEDADYVLACGYDLEIFYGI